MPAMKEQIQHTIDWAGNHTHLYGPVTYWTLSPVTVLKGGERHHEIYVYHASRATTVGSVWGKTTEVRHAALSLMPWAYKTKAEHDKAERDYWQQP